MVCEIISIGNELLNGKTVNTNATFISKKLFESGLEVRWVQTIGDSGDEILRALKTAESRAQIILITGGLGPTHDDITKKTLAGYFNSRLVVNPKVLKEVEERFRRRGIPMPEINRTQAEVPDNARLMPNPIGTAPGFIFERENRLIFVMPGVPREMKAMMENSVIPLLTQKFPECRVKVLLFRTTGIAESVIYEKIHEGLSRFPDFELAFLPNFTGVDIRVILRGDAIDDSGRVNSFKDMLEKHIGEFIYSDANEDLEAVIGSLLKKGNLTLAVAESMTGGQIQDRLTAVSGSSAYFMGGAVCYSNQSKMKLLGVKENDLTTHGAVSERVAAQMAEGVRKLFGTDIGISTTGIAGPTGATPTKPLGLVYIGISGEDMTRVVRYTFGTDRQINKTRASHSALDLVRRYLLDLPIR